MPNQTTTTTWTTPLAFALTQAGLSDATVDILSQYYPNAAPRIFLAGLDWLTQATKTMAVPSASLPTEEPWSILAQAAQGHGAGDIMDAVLTALAAWAPDLQTALFNGMGERNAFLDTQQGSQPTRKSKRIIPTTEYLAALSNMGLGFRLNVLNDLIEVNGIPITDAQAASFRAQMRDRGYADTSAMEDAYTHEAYVNRFNPVLEKLDALAWDGEPHIANLASHFTDKDGAFPIFLRRWLIGAVAKARVHAQNRMLVLEGNQGIGKSHLASWLSEPFGADLWCEGPIDPEDKDCNLRLASKFLWEVSELGATQRRADREMLKGFLTRITVVVRRPYGRFDLMKPALTSFIGTVNEEGGILNDPTGSRRFMVAVITAVDWKYSAEIDPAQVWAEANAAFLAGESGALLGTEAQLAQRINSEHEMDEPAEGLLLKYFHVDPTDNRAWTPSVDIITTLEANGLHGPTRANMMALAAVMKSLGVNRARRRLQNGGQVWGYEGVTVI